MDESRSRDNPQTSAVHPAVLRVSGDETRRWCAAVWSVSPGAPQLVEEIRGLAESTLGAHWMQPPAQYEPDEGAVNSFDLVFYEGVGDELADRLRSDGWEPVEMLGMATDEYEQFEVFVEEAEDHGISVSGRPDALWRAPVSTAPAPGGVAWQRLGADVAEMLGEDVWGDSPGWFSRAYCRKLGEVGELEITPDLRGLATLEEVVAGPALDNVRWIDGMAYQALCDFIGVVVQAETPMEVQWGTCPVDEETGLAPMPLLRMRKGGGWTRIPVGRDVVRRICIPWGRDETEPGEICTGLIDEYGRMVDTTDGR